MRQPRSIGPIANDLDVLIGKLTEQNGRVIEVSSRMRQDALLLVELQQEISVTLSRIWTLHEEAPPAPIPPPAPRILRQAEVLI